MDTQTLKLKSGACITVGFDRWMHYVDKACERRVGLSIYDLTDQPFSEWFEDGLHPVRAARRAIKNSGGPD